MLTAAGGGDKIFIEEAIDLPIYNAQILEIDAKETRRYAGLRKAQDFGEKNIRDACAEALLLIEVRGAWNVYDYKAPVVQSEPPFTIAGKSILKHLDGCERVICMAFERGGYLASVLLDAAATTAVEQAADAMERHFATMFAKDGFKLRWRFSPGYGDWDLTAQEKLFTISGAEQIGMSLTSAMMLEPRKSITAIIGLTKELSTRRKNCVTCDKLDCPARK